MYQNYNYYPQQTTQPPVQQTMPFYQQSYLRPAQQQTALKGRLVSSLEEARATSIDFDGSVFYFPDLANKRIYTKQINMDGTASLNMYELRELPVEEKQQLAPSMDAYITRDEFEKAIEQLRAKLISEQPIVTASQQLAKQKEVLNF